MNNGVITSAVSAQDQKAIEQKEQKEAIRTMRALIGKMQGEIKNALPAVLTPERFTRMVLSAISVTPDLAKCTPESFLGAMMGAAQLGLEPNTSLGLCYLLPYNNRKKGVKECQLQIGYRGMIDLAHRSGEVVSIQAEVVYENDLFEMEYGLEPKLRHVPAPGERGQPVRVYAVYKTKSGGFGFGSMTMAECEEFAKKKSKSFDSGPWQTDFEAMCLKTVLKRVLKTAPMKSDFARGIAQDETIKTELSDDMYTVPNEMQYDDQEAEKSAEVTDNA